MKTIFILQLIASISARFNFRFNPKTTDYFPVKLLNYLIWSFFNTKLFF